MSDSYTPITQGLREDLKVAQLWLPKRMVENLLVDCDNIDAIHRTLEQENERLRDASECGDDCIKLPVDADKVVIREGDELWSDTGIWVKVKWLEYKNGKWAVFVENKIGICFYAIFEDMHHYRPDTWERIIEDATELGFTDPDNEHLRDKLVARCKTLAGDAE